MALIYKCRDCGTPLGFDGLCWRCRARQERQVVLSWTASEINEKVQHLIACVDHLDSWQTPEYQDASKLLEVHGIFPPALQLAAAQAGVTCLEQLYYHAPAQVRDILIERLLAAEDPHEAGKLMCCLAMQGDDRALAVLLDLERHPRPWRTKLYVDPSVYAQCGGWTFDRQGLRLALIYDTCYVMETGGGNRDAAVIGRPREDVCPHCKSRLTDILVLDGQDERLGFLGLNGIFTATCCPNCCVYADAVFSRFTLDGGSTPIFPYQDLPDCMDDAMDPETYTGLTGNSYVLGASPVPVFYGAGSEDLNTIGGFANWVQDWQYTICPDCGKPMRYLAQLQWDTLTDYMEGTLYIEVCPGCGVASMNHQQT